MDVDIVLGASSTKLPAHVGYLKAVETAGYNAKRLALCSGGAIIGGAYATGMPLDEIENRMMKMDFSQFVGFGLFSKIRFLRKGYLDSGTKYYKMLKGIFGDIKLGELDIETHIIASNYTFNDANIFSSVDTPRVKLVDAVYMSSTIPGVFKPMRYEGDSYRDGGIHKLFPWDIWADVPRFRLGHLINHKNYSLVEDNWGPFAELEAYISNACMANVNEALRDGPSEPHGYVTFTEGRDCNGGEISILKFDLSRRDKRSLVLEGHNEAVKTLEKFWLDRAVKI